MELVLEKNTTAPTDVRMQNPPVIAIKDAAAHMGEEIEIRGWCANLRSSGAISFLQLRDGSGLIQGVAYTKYKRRSLCDFAAGILKSQ